MRRTPEAEFAKGAEVKTVDPGEDADPDMVVHRAESRLGERAYSILRNNCEHFSRWCTTGVATSSQVKTVLRTAAGLGMGALLVGLYLARPIISGGGPRRA